MTPAAPSLAAVRKVFDAHAPPGTPLTTAEVAERFDCTARTVYNRLDALVEEGALETKKVGARGRVWWRPSDREEGCAPDEGGPNAGATSSDVARDEYDEDAERRLEEERDMFADGPAVVFRWNPNAGEGWPVEFVTQNVEKVFGYAPAELESGAVLYTDLLLEEETDRIAREVAEATDEMAERFSHEPYRVQTRDGDIKWVKDTTKIVRDDDGEVASYLGYLIDITERARAEEQLKRTNDALERLNAANRELIDTDAESFSRRVAEIAGTVLDVSRATVWRYDGSTGELREEAIHSEPEADGEESGRRDGVADAAWQTFLTNEITVENGAAPTDSPLESRALIPLGRHGVICAESTDADRFDRQTVDLVETLAATIETAWDSAEGEKRLADRNEQLQALDRLNGLIRDIDQALVEAESVDDIDQAVCEHLAGAEQYEFAWIGELDLQAGTVAPREWAGVDRGYLDGLAVETEADGTEQGPIAAALRMRELQVVSDVAVDPRAAAWREATLERDARSCIVIPLVYNGSLYGVLTVYADRPQPDERDHTVLAELGETIAHAIDAVETKRTLLTDDVTELTLELRHPDDVLAALARTTEGEFTFDGIVPRSDDGARLFFTATAVAAEDVLDAARDRPAIAAVTLLWADDGECAFEATVTEPTIASHVVDGRGVMRSLTATPEATTAVVDLPATATVRAFIEHLRTAFPDVILAKRRTRDRPITTPEDLRDAVSARLTDRQREVLETAYRSGFFESPRVRNGEDLSEILDISQSTFSYHLRGAQQHLSELVFENR